MVHDLGMRRATGILTMSGVPVSVVVRNGEALVRPGDEARLRKRLQALCESNPSHYEFCETNSVCPPTLRGIVLTAWSRTFIDSCATAWELAEIEACVKQQKATLHRHVGPDGATCDIFERNLCERICGGLSPLADIMQPADKQRTLRFLLFLRRIGALEFSMKAMVTPGQVLGVSESANTEQIKIAYRKLARHLHPDRHVGAAVEKQKSLQNQFSDVSDAYHKLLNRRAISR